MPSMPGPGCRMRVISAAGDFTALSRYHFAPFSLQRFDQNFTHVRFVVDNHHSHTISTGRRSVGSAGSLLSAPRR